MGRHSLSLRYGGVRRCICALMPGCGVVFCAGAARYGASGQSGRDDLSELFGLGSLVRRFYLTALHQASSLPGSPRFSVVRGSAAPSIPGMCHPYFLTCFFVYFVYDLVSFMSMPYRASWTFAILPRRFFSRVSWVLYCRFVFCPGSASH